MVGVSLEESTISESSLDASTAPTTLTGRSTFNSSRDFIHHLPNPTHSKRSRKERSSSSVTETLTKDLSLLLRSNSRSKCDPYTGSQTVLHPLPEEYKDHSDYAHNPSRNPSNSSKLDLELPMFRPRDTDKVKRSENKFYGFLRRGRLASRSAPKKRRSRSADEINQMDPAIQSTLSLANDSHSVRDHAPRLPPPIKHVPTNPSSRPLSTPSVTPNKQLPHLPSDTTASTPHAAVNSPHPIGEPEHPKPRKKTFFGIITLPASRRSSISKSRPTTPHSSTPDNSLNSRHQRKLEPSVPSSSKHHDIPQIPLNDATNYGWNGDVAGQRSQPSFEISEPDSGLGFETIFAKKVVTVVSPRSHLNPVSDVPTRASSTPPRIGNGVYKPRKVSVDETDRLRLPDPNLSGRISPLMKPFGKGKERERCVNRTNDTRKATPAPTSENQKGRESRNSKPSTPNISDPIKLTRKVRHGSFDFERPLSTSAGYPVRAARWSSSGPYSPSKESERNATPRGNGHPWNGPNPSTYPIQEERSSLTRSQSVRESDLENNNKPKIRFTEDTKDTKTQSRNSHDTRSRTRPQTQHPSLPSKSAERELGPSKNGNSASTHTRLPYRPQGGSWGRNPSQRGYSNGFPSFGASATSLHQDGNTTEYFSRSNSPQAVTLPMGRREMISRKGNGRSLDLGLGLSWAPTRMREEAVMDFSEMGVRSKWREEAEVKESYRMGVLKSFEQKLGESEYAKFREYVQRFDSRLMSPDGPSGLMHKVKRLLDNSSRVLDAKDKKELLEKLDHVVLHPR